MGLAALHIANWSDFPIFFYGQHYMATIDAYLAAPLIVVFGPSVPALRGPELVIFAVFLFSMYHLVVALYGSAWFATVTVGLLALGGDRVLTDEMTAQGGSAELKPIAALLILTAVAAAIAGSRQRFWLFGAFGFLAGLALWDHWLVLPYLIGASALLLGKTRRTRRKPDLMALTIGALVGAGPLIAYNLSAGIQENSIFVFARLTGISSTASFSQRFFGDVLLGVPLATGACEPGRCSALARTWGVAYLVLLGTSLFLAVRGIRRRRKGTSLQWGRIVLVFSAILSILAYFGNARSGLSPLESARYLSLLPVSTPAVLWPLWVNLSRRSRLNPVAFLCAGVIATLMIFATIKAITTGVPEDRVAAREEDAVLATLKSEGVRSVYSEYWLCNRLSYRSGEKTVCAALRDDLQPGLDRWVRYRNRVNADPHPAYIFTTDSVLDANFRSYASKLAGILPPVRIGNYNLYRPSASIPLPANKGTEALRSERP